MNVLYISYDGMTDPLGQSQVIPYLANLSASNVNIVLLSCEKPERFEKEKKNIAAILEKAGIKWVPLSYTKHPPVVSTLWDIFKLEKKAHELHKTHHFNIVHCRSYIASLVGLRLKEKNKLKFIFDMRGFWADERVDGEIWNLKNPVYKMIYGFFKRKEKEFLQKADYTIALTYASKDEIHSWKNIPGQPIPIEVIPCCADLELFNPHACNPDLAAKYRDRFKIGKDNFVLIYSGSIGTWYMLDEMLDFFKRLLIKKPGARFLIVTLEDAGIIYEQSRKKEIPDNRLIISPAKREEMPVFLKMADIAIFFIKPVFSKKASSPTKQGEIMGMGIPSICNSGIGDTGSVIEKYRAGFIVNEFSDKEYDRVINEMFGAAKFSPEQIMQGAREFYSLEEGVRRYRSVYSKLAT